MDAPIPVDPEINRLLRSFSQRPLTAVESERVARMRARFVDLANVIADSVDGPEGAVALRKLREAKDAAIVGLIFGA